MITPSIMSQIKKNSTGQVIWKDISPNDRRKIFNNFTLNNNILGDIFVSIKQIESPTQGFNIFIKNKLDKILGTETISINKDKEIFGFNIIVEPEYRRKKFKFGEILRLASIMEMIENKVPHIKIYSKNSAIYFHSKYKFIPNIKNFEERNKALNTILQDKTKGYENFCKQAEQLLNEISNNQNNPAKQRSLCGPANKLINEYIQKALTEEKPDKLHSFNYGMDMILKQDDVIKHKNFFNNLFQKHKINYHIQ